MPSDIFVHARTAFNKADWLHLVLSPTVAVGGVKECGIFMNEITTEAGAWESPDWSTGAESPLIIVTDVRGDSVKV